MIKNERENKLINIEIYKNINKSNIKMLTTQNRAITLITLVITIVLLIILAGIIINIAMGENGIIKKAKQAKEQYSIQVAKEKIELEVAEYEVRMRKETIYSMLNKVEGLESIEPNNKEAGLPYVVIVDGYEFLVKEGIQVIYQGKRGGIIPEITKYEKEKQGEKIKLKIEARTEDKDGIQEIRLIKNGIEIETKIVNGKQISEEFEIMSNGKYKIKVIGKNKKHKTSNEINIEEFATLSGTIQAGTIINGGVTLTIEAKSEKEKISKLEIYYNSNKIGEIECGTNEVNKEYEIEDIPFWEEGKCYAKIIENSGISIDTNIAKVKNINTIKTANDLRKFIQVVNTGEDFSQKTINQIADIDLTIYALEAIGTSEHPFKGTYDGQKHRIENINIIWDKPMQGLFGYVENATIKNITLGVGRIRGENRVGSAVGYAYNSNLENITNEAVIVEATTQYSQTINSYNYVSNKITTGTSAFVAVGGICGKSENTFISNCNNKKDISISIKNGIGGIVGLSIGENIKTIENCTNSGNISNGAGTGGIVGIASGGVINENAEVLPNIKNCVNSGNITAQNWAGGIIGWNYGLSTGEGYYLITKCSNTGTITTSSSVEANHWWQGQYNKTSEATCGGITAWSVKTKILDCNNSGIVQSICTSVNNGIAGIAGFLGASEVSRCSNFGKIVGGNSTGVGGIVGFGCKNVNINNCYNKNEIEGNSCVAGIAGWISQANIRNCYNNGLIQGNSSVSGIVGWIGPHDNNSYTNNYLYNCYNIGNITGKTNISGISSWVSYYDVDYIYSLEGTATSIWGTTYTANKNGTHVGLVDDTTLQNIVTQWEGFEEDGNNINDGYPILAWQVSGTPMP
ncbi:MAG: hypothetical protein HFJ42_09920 [Clostridia bacterium]|nr:hypothetical protein [Clostridia bacterium]